MPIDTFFTSDGVEVPAVSTKQMREIDRLAIEDTGPNLFQMMENAGRNLAELCTVSLGSSWSEAHIVVLAGPGGNGGGGICAARHLANHGGSVTLVATNADGLHPVPAQQFELYRHTESPSASTGELGTVRPDLIIDAVLGYSASGAPRGVSEELIGWMSAMNVPIVSLDVPSGIDATTGQPLGIHVTATTTMTLALPKTGLDVEAVGKLWVADLGIPRSVFAMVGVTPPPELFRQGYRMRLTSA